MFPAIILAASLLCACGGDSSASLTTAAPPASAAPAPTITASAAQSGASIVTIADSAPGVTIYYTLDGATPTTASQIYQAPFLVSSNITVRAIASVPGSPSSTVASKAFAPTIAPNTLVWSEEFNSPSPQPSASTWTYDIGTNCCGNHEYETYCAYASTASNCDPSNPNAFIASDGLLHIVARKPADGVYTSARLKSQGLFSFMYGRIEARMKLPESQAMWPAFWLLGNNITTVNWPACGELDIMEHINGDNSPFYVGAAPPGYDWIAGSIHFGTETQHKDGSEKFHPAAFSAADWHTYGMIWTKGEIQFYVDDPASVYATYKATDPAFASGAWPFDLGPQFVILNLAVGGDWPGKPDATTVFPSDMLVDYVRIYTN